MNRQLLRGLLLAAAATTPFIAQGSSHREAPFIAGMPRLDASDFYMFRSYETGHEATVTFIANYIPLQEPQGGPNFFALDSKGLYEVNIDNNGDGKEDITFQFRFTDVYKNLIVPAGGANVAVPLLNIGAVTPAGANVNMTQTYKLGVVRNGRRSAVATAVQNTTAAETRSTSLWTTSA